jgi:hypothetical protein
VDGKRTGTLKSAKLGEEVSGVGQFQNGKLTAFAVIFRSKSSDNLSKDKIPYGIRVPNKPNLVISPYSPAAGPVDVTGYARGTQVKDPYTNEIFLVP